MKRLILLLVTMSATMVVASGVALAVTKIGGPGPDHLRGTNGDDILIGRGGNDTLLSLAGNDDLLGGRGKDWALGTNEQRALGGNKNLVGGPGNDGFSGGRGSDNLLGGSGNDFADGDRGSDNISGADGNDFLSDGGVLGGAKDNLSAGDGNDVIWTFNESSKRDVVTCGGGFDRVLADRADMVAPDCERVARGHAAVEQLNQRIEESGFYDRPSEGLAPFPL